MFQRNVLLAYFSPETVLPVSSIIATLAGCALMIRRSSWRFAARYFRAAHRRWRRRSVLGTNRPHFRIRAKQVSQQTSS
jgi:hypothetical protein